MQFPNRAAWADHEFIKHRVNQFWTCPECPESSSTAVGWANHLEAVHQRAFSGPNLEVARDMAYNAESRPVENEECPFCRVFLRRPRRAFIKHVGSHMEEIALMALPRDHLSDLEDKSVMSREGSMRTSRLPASSDFTQNNTLPGLSSVASSKPSQSVSDVMRPGQMNRAQRIMVPDSDDALEPTYLPPMRGHNQDHTLECPFPFLKCFRQFASSNEREWIRHSFEHFKADGRESRSVDPPKTNRCCFCPRTFTASSGTVSWRERMDHVKVHHQHFGHRLAAARPDFALIEYLCQSGLLSPADHRDLKPSTTAPVESQYDYLGLPAKMEFTHNHPPPDLGRARSSRHPASSDGTGDRQMNRALRDIVPEPRPCSGYDDSDIDPVGLYQKPYEPFPRRFKCPVVGCGRNEEGNGFRRRDNLEQHYRGVHGGRPAPASSRVKAPGSSSIAAQKE